MKPRSCDADGTLLDVSSGQRFTQRTGVSDALSELQGVENVDVSLNDARAVVRHDPAAAPIANLIAAVSDAGYDATKRE